MKKGKLSSSKAATDIAFEASPATRAETGIANYHFDTKGNGTVSAADGATVATLSSEGAKRVLRVYNNGRNLEIIYKIKPAKTAGGIGIKGTVDGAPFAVGFEPDGSPTGNSPKLDRAFDAICRTMAHDWMKAKAKGIKIRRVPSTMVYFWGGNAYCGGLNDALLGADKANEWLAALLLAGEMTFNC